MPRAQGKIHPPVNPISRQAAYNKISAHFLEAFETLLDVMKTSQNPSDRIAAAKIIINKVIPDLKATEFTGEAGNAIAGLINIIKDSAAK